MPNISILYSIIILVICKEIERGRITATNKKTRSQVLQFFSLLKYRFCVIFSSFLLVRCRYSSHGQKIRRWLPECILEADFLFNVFSIYKTLWFLPKLLIKKSPCHLSISFWRCGVEFLRSTKLPELKYCIFTPLLYQIFSCSFLLTDWFCISSSISIFQVI